MKDPQYIYELDPTSSLKDVINKTNEIIYNINFMWNHDSTGSKK